MGWTWEQHVSKISSAFRSAGIDITFALYSCTTRPDTSWNSLILLKIVSSLSSTRPEVAALFISLSFIVSSLQSK
jgi:hypothetical protein